MTLSRCLLMLTIVACVALVGCGSDAATSDPLEQQATANDSIDSLPGETASGGDVATTVTISQVDDQASSAAGSDSSVTQESSVGDGSGREARVLLGAEVLAEKNFQEIAGKRVGVIASTASIADGRHIVDVLEESSEVELAAIFAPEHGFRSDRPSGEAVGDDEDPTTGLPVYSLYGTNFKPPPSTLDGIDALVFDLQDVGTRYYTFISTMGLAMQAAAQADVEFIVLDRPNPQGGELVSGPSSSPDVESMVSLYPIPSVYGMTVGELAKAIVGEAWLDGLEDLQLTVVPMQGWQRNQRWEQTGLVWYPPSPGLPTPESAITYPAVVLFEATTVSFGQGTDRPFAQIGAPWLETDRVVSRLGSLGLPDVEFETVAFTPEPTISAPEPAYVGQSVSGIRIAPTGSDFEPSTVGLHLLDIAMDEAPADVIDRRAMFDLLAGGNELRQSLLAGQEPDVIIAGWQTDLERFRALRRQYLLYD